MHFSSLPKIKTTEATLSLFLYPCIQIFIYHHTSSPFSILTLLFQPYLFHLFLSAPHMKDNIYNHNIPSLYLIFHHMSLCGSNTLLNVLVYLSPPSTEMIKLCVFSALSPAQEWFACTILSFKTSFSVITSSFSYIPFPKEEYQDILLIK